MAITYNAGNRLVSPDSSLVNDTTGWSASGSYITVDTTNNELDFTYSGSANNYTNFDLGVITSDNWVLRFKYEIKTYTGIDSGYLQWAFGVVSAASNSISGAVDGILLVNTVQSSLNRYRLYTLNNSKISGGSATVATFTKTSAVQTLYVEIERKGSLAKIRLFTNSDYSGSGEEVTCSCVGVDSLRYIQGAIYDEGSAMTYTSSISNVQFFDSEPRLTADGTLVNGTTYTDSYSGKEHILNYGAWAEKNQPSSNIGELLHDHSSLGKQHFWDWFSGSSLNSCWSQYAVNAPASFAMNASIDGGFRITADSGANNEGMINFNNIRPYSHTGSVAIWIEKDVQTSSYTGYCGLANGITGVDSDFPEIALLYNWSVNTNMGLRTGDASTKSTTESSVALDTNWHCHKIELTSSNVTHTIDGVLETTKTTNRPTAKLQPVAGVFGNGKSIDVRYCEAYNT